MIYLLFVFICILTWNQQIARWNQKSATFLSAWLDCSTRLNDLHGENASPVGLGAHHVVPPRCFPVVFRMVSIVMFVSTRWCPSS